MGTLHRVESFTLCGASASVGSCCGSGYLGCRSQMSYRDMAKTLAEVTVKIGVAQVTLLSPPLSAF